ncbi:hypothetical protein [Aquabacterium sp.]|uniref:hypothetical protein n=1 Tax=Aquabacterium sp. TaxID=1872578 RepID=UPI002B76A493|nr:hypothetical protein [Aquabacterium sp.]HSW07551.1 hypothetical protein [Aquabacterium sp.]
MSRCRLAAAAATAALVLLSACSSKPPTPDWQMNAHASMQRTLEAYLLGDTRLEALEFDRARSAIASTGRLPLMARAELMRCAARVASLVFEPCPNFDALQQDADAADLAYAGYLAAQPLSAPALALLPPAQRPFAVAQVGGPGDVAVRSGDPANAAVRVGGPGDAAALQQIEDPLSRLVAAAVLLRNGQAHPATMAVAVDTASAQGWRRPLLAWLNVQLRVAEQHGDNPETQRLKRRIGLVQGPAR